ncbi:MAG: CoA transferase subunit A [Actinobacteria bacterium]|nr:CoA transferase subunit A [Actinomycetota bacterium]
MRVGSWDDAVALVDDGMRVGFSGAILRGKPVAAALALAAAGRRDLELVTFTGSVEVEALLAAGALRSVVSSYVGLGPYGQARGFGAAVGAGAIDDREMSEWMLVGGLRAATMGLPFLPTRAGLGSQLAEDRGLATVRDPYTGEEFLAVPALHLDVAFVHAWRADADGNVQLPWPPDHLADVDILTARSARTTIVSVEQIVPHEVVAAHAERTKLFGFEVDLLVEAPNGAWPGSVPPLYHDDRDWLRAHGADAGAALLERARA